MIFVNVLPCLKQMFSIRPFIFGELNQRLLELKVQRKAGFLLNPQIITFSTFIILSEINKL